MAKTKTPSASSSAPVWSHAGDVIAEDAELCIAYCAGRDVAARPMADESVIPFDLMTNRAHCAMLCRQRIITPAQLAAITRGLDEIERLMLRNEFKLDPALEDVHINIERAVAGISGEEAAGVMHTARSRNDQTTTDIRLWMRVELLRVVEALTGTVAALAQFAARHGKSVMGGWTHGQPAMPTSLGHWAAAHGHALARDLQALRDLWPFINQSPLGAAAGFGSSWPIDRKLTAAWLGFDAPQSNSLDCVSTRWEAESRFGFALSIMMTHLSSLGQDLYFLSSPPQRLIDLAPAFTTGSSIMPQKRNPDFAEVTRARTAAVQSLVTTISAVGRGALSGYNRDSQWTKYWIMDLVHEVGSAPEVFARVIATLKPNLPALERQARTEFISAVDLADTIASTRKIEFRRLYHVVAKAVMQNLASGQFRLETVNALLRDENIHPPLTAAELEQINDPRLAIQQRKSLGSPSPQETARQSKELLEAAAEAKRWGIQRQKALEKAAAKLREETSSMIANK